MRHKPNYVIKRLEKPTESHAYASQGIPFQPGVMLAFLGAKLCLATDRDWELEVLPTAATLVQLAQTLDPVEMGKALFELYAEHIHYRHKVSGMKMSLYGVRNPILMLVDCVQNDQFAEATGAYLCAAAVEAQAYIEYRRGVRMVQETEVEL